MANITTANWATFFATTPDNWTFDLTNRVFEFTGDPSLDEDFRFITFDVDFAMNHLNLFHQSSMTYLQDRNVHLYLHTHL